jgi:uncharacterized membrane protein YgcG
MMTRPCALAGTAVLVGLLAAPAQATPILEQTLIATGGDVVVTFMTSGAGYTSELFLDGPVGDETGAIFNNSTTDLGSSVNLGSFAAGTELVFKLLVQQTGDAFFTGDASRNLDGLVHALMESAAGQVLVGFEDLYGGGDLDYDDLVFAFANVIATSNSGDDEAGGTPGSTPSTSGGGSSGGAGPIEATVDEPGTLLLLGSGLVMLGVVMKRQTARR